MSATKFRPVLDQVRGLDVTSADEVLSLPIGPHHTAEQIDTVCAAVRSFFDQR